MEIIVPSLKLFDLLEEKANESYITLLDTNIFSPNLRDENSASLNPCDIFRFFETGEYNADDLIKVRKAFKSYTWGYFSRLSKLLENNQSITTTNQVLSECDGSIGYFLRSSKDNRKIARSLGRGLQKSVRRNIASMEKQVLNGLVSTLEVFKDRHVFKEDSFKSGTLYEDIFSKVTSVSRGANHVQNGLFTDAHLVTNAIYLSACTGSKINIYSSDAHIPFLLRQSWEQHLSKFFSKSQDENSNFRPKISTFRPSFSKGVYILASRRLDGRKLHSSTEIIE